MSEDRDPTTGQFIKGKTGGPGRPRGARNKLGEAFIADLQADWEEHGPKTIQTVREDRPDVYLKVVASILPRDLNVNVNGLEDKTDDELIARLRELNSIIGPFLVNGGNGGDSGDPEAKTRH